MKKKLEVKLELNKQTIAKLDPKSMKKIKGGGDPAGDDGDGTSASRKDSKGSDCSCTCCAGTTD